MKKLFIFCTIALSVSAVIFSCKKQDARNDGAAPVHGRGDDVGGSGSGTGISAMLYTEDGLDAGTIESKDSWSTGLPISSSNWATKTPYCLSSYDVYVPQPCPISFKRNNGNGTCGASGQIRVSFHDNPVAPPTLDSIYYNGSRIS